MIICYHVTSIKRGKLHGLELKGGGEGGEEFFFQDWGQTQSLS